MTTDRTSEEDRRHGGDAPGTRAWLEACVGTASDRRNQAKFLLWMLVWMASYTLAAQTLKGNLRDYGLAAEGWAAVALAALPNLLALGALLAYLRFLRMADELTRLIQLQGLAVGFGVWFFLALGWELFEKAGAAPLADDFMLLIPTFSVGLAQLFLGLRYR